MKRVFLLFLAMSIAILVISTNNVSASDYPYKSVCGSSSNCGGKVFPGDYEKKFDDPKKNYWVDSLSLFAQCNCTSYVAFRLNEDWQKMGMSEPAFCNSYLGQKWGDAGNWIDAAKKVGIEVDEWPRPGDVAWWGRGKNLPDGHVAYVERAYSDGTVDVPEYNFKNACGYGERFHVKADFYLHITTHHMDCYETGLCEGFENGKSGSTGGMGGIYVISDPSSSSKKPDLFVKEARLARDNDGSKVRDEFYPRENIYAVAWVKNVGKNADKDSKVGFYLSKGEKPDENKDRIGRENIKKENLKKGATKKEYIKFDAPSKPGKYNIVIRADDEKKIDESNEDNNWSGTLVFKVREYPDFLITEVSFNGDDGIFSPGETILIKAIGKNQGGDSDSDVRLAYYITYPLGETILIDTDNIRDYHMESGESKGENTTFIAPDEVGIYTVTVIIDYQNNIKEGNEANNSFTTSFEVQ